MKEGAETERYASDVAFSAGKGGADAQRVAAGLSAMEQNGSWQTLITPDLAAFIEAQTSIFLATASKDGQPYIQHRGGPAGFLKVLDEKTIGFADFAGNRQFVSLGNLAENPKAHLFLIDYVNQPTGQDLGRGAHHRG